MHAHMADFKVRQLELILAKIDPIAFNEGAHTVKLYSDYLQTVAQLSWLLAVSGQNWCVYKTYIWVNTTFSYSDSWQYK